jgi:flagellar biosynthesis/type III secretory pathway ATPase
LPRVFERAGKFRRGSITGFFTVLVEGDDLTEPISDAVRATLDGHIVLSRHLAAVGHYPPIDVLNSVSRLSTQVMGKEQRESARKLREALATYQQSEDLIQLGAYVSGSNPTLDAAIRARPKLLEFLQQEADRKWPLEETVTQLETLAKLL